jgi:hypothetical protein
MFRFQNAGRLDDPWIKSLVEELEQESPEFRDWWAGQSVSEAQSCHFTVDHPFAGRLYFDHAELLVADSPSLQLQCCVSDGGQTRQRLDDLVRQLRHGHHGPVHNVWAALRAGTSKPGTATAVMSRP